MQVLAFRHVPFEGLGLIEAALAAAELPSQIVDLHAGALVPAHAERAAGLIFMGGPMSVNDDLPYLREEEQLIRAAAAAGTPVLGVCLGAQLIARALGAEVRRNPVKEIGWFDIRMTQAAGDDLLFAGLSGPETVFHWHGETFDLPSGAVLLGSSDHCRNQAFRYGAGVYGLQFHLEVTPEMVEDWCLQDANCGDVRELDAEIDPGFNAARLAEMSRIVFGRWCRLAGRRAGETGNLGA